jgi:hypothetical protein
MKQINISIITVEMRGIIAFKTEGILKNNPKI